MYRVEFKLWKQNSIEFKPNIKYQIFNWTQTWVAYCSNLISIDYITIHNEIQSLINKNGTFGAIKLRHGILYIYFLLGIWRDKTKQGARSSVGLFVYKQIELDATSFTQRNSFQHFIIESMWCLPRPHFLPISMQTSMPTAKHSHMSTVMSSIYFQIFPDSLLPFLSFLYHSYH